MTLRAACGLAVLSLLAIQQKVCAWREPTPPQTAPSESKRPKGPPLTLGVTLPDAAQPRWPQNPVAFRAPADAAGGGDAEARAPGAGGSSSAAFLAAIRPSLAAGAGAGVSLSGRGGVRVVERHFETSVSRTGPPGVHTL